MPLPPPDDTSVDFDAFVEQYRRDVMGYSDDQVSDELRMMRDDAMDLAHMCNDLQRQATQARSLAGFLVLLLPVVAAGGFIVGALMRL